jgi:hypothetical protein
VGDVRDALGPCGLWVGGGPSDLWVGGGALIYGSARYGGRDWHVPAGPGPPSASAAAGPAGGGWRIGDEPMTGGGGRQNSN